MCLPHCSEAGQKNRQAIQSNFLLSVLTLQNLSQAIEGRQADRALEGILLYRDHEGVAREKLNVCRFLATVLVVSNPTFSANRERLPGVDSALPH